MHIFYGILYAHLSQQVIYITIRDSVLIKQLLRMRYADALLQLHTKLYNISYLYVVGIPTYIIRNVWTLNSVADDLSLERRSMYFIAFSAARLVVIRFVCVYITSYGTYIGIGTLWWLPPATQFLHINNMSKYFHTCAGCVNVTEIWPSTLCESSLLFILSLLFWKT